LIEGSTANDECLDTISNDEWLDTIFGSNAPGFITLGCSGSCQSCENEVEEREIHFYHVDGFTSETTEGIGGLMDREIGTGMCVLCFLCSTFNAGLFNPFTPPITKKFL
jgi:hypothetical protein